jgi:hypothetical protein
MSHQIFVCAAPRDKIATNAVRAVLEAEGLSCWIASRDLPSGVDPVETVRAAIAAAQVMLLIFSARANEAEEQIKRELQFAAHSQTPVLPFRVENVRPIKGLEYYLPANQFMDAFPAPLDPHLRRLVAMLKPVLEKAPPRPPMAAPEPAPPSAQVEPPPSVAAPAQDISPVAPETELTPRPAETETHSPKVTEAPEEPAPAAAPVAAQATKAELPASSVAVRPPISETVQQPELSAVGPSHGKDALPWYRKPVALALMTVAAVIIGAALWWFLKPAPSARELQAWNGASRQDAIPAYQTYLGAWPKGFYRGQATTRIATLKSQAEDAFAKAKAANTSAAYEGFLARYSIQGVDVSEARAADDTIRAEEAKAKAAFDAATSAHSRESYKSFLADFGSSAYAADARQRLAACHTEIRNATTVKDTPLSENETGSGGSSSEACEAARNSATSKAESSCRESQGQMGSVRVVSETPQNDGLQGGRILGSIFGAITGSKKTSWKCSEEISVSCRISATGVHQVDVCP